MNRQEWLQERMKGLGGSDASAILGMNPYKSNIELWQEKTGRVVPEDIGHKPYVKYGNDAEKYLVSLFELDYPEYQVVWNDKFKIHKNPDHQFIYATLDAELTDQSGKQGVLEVKTTEILKSMQWEQWKDGIPNNYYIQVLHQLLATGWGYGILKAQLKTVYSEEVRLNTRHYRIERSEVQEDLDYLLEQEIRFWQHVEKDTKPPLVLPPI